MNAYLLIKTKLPFSIRIKNLLNIYSIPKQYIMPVTGTSRRCSVDPPWTQVEIRANLCLANHPKNGTPPELYKDKFYRELLEKFRGWNIVYTDGSKSEAGVGSAAVTETQVRTDSLPAYASVFTAELYAIGMALVISKETHDQKTVIASD